jgi:hypothetical protein
MTDTSQPKVGNAEKAPKQRHPETEYEAEYYYNKKQTTESGHEMEWDDTPGKERIRMAHKSGSYTEFTAKGDKVDNIVGREYKYNTGGFTQTVDENSDLKYNGNLRVSIGMHQHVEVNGAKTESIAEELAIAVNKGASIVIIEDLYIVAKNVTISASEHVNIDSGGDIGLNAGGNINLNAGAGMSIKAEGGDIQMATAANMGQQSDGTFNMTASGTMTATAPKIDLNP